MKTLTRRAYVDQAKDIISKAMHLAVANLSERDYVEVLEWMRDEAKVQLDAVGEGDDDVE